MTEKNGIFITIEGPDGSGKSTQIRLMVDYLSQAGHDVLVTREPGGCPISERIRQVILDVRHKEMDPVTEMLLYAASRAQHVAQVIEPALEAGEIVICDRFLDSSIAYQGYGRQLGEELVLETNRAALRGIRPDITFFFSMDPGKALHRKEEDRPMDRLEQEEADFHQRVYEGYRILAERDSGRIRTIDAARPIEEVHGQIRSILDQLLKDR
ncbi:MAG: dTMP kinase [Clostridia bacterium]|jgi:dTMP kinase